MKIVIVEEEAKLVREMHQDYLSGLSTSQIAKKLNTQPIRYNEKKSSWERGHVSYIFKDSAYLGNEDYPKIVEKEIKDAVLELTENKVHRIPEEEQAHAEVFKDKMRCSVCGKVIARRSIQKGRLDLVHMRCVNKECECSKTSIHLVKLEEYGTKYCNDSPTIDEERLHNGILKAMNMMQKNAEDIRTLLYGTIAEVLASSNTDKDDTVLKINVTIENRRNLPMEYMYLCHINFRPVDGAELVYSGDYNNVRVYKSGNESGELLEYVNDLEKNPLQHHVVGGKNQNYNPEICLGINYAGDENNCAYTLQCFDDGACYVKHPVDALPYAIRWISRTGDEDSMGMVLPATSEHLGYTHAKKNGQVKVLPGNSSISFEIEAGYIDKEQLENVKKKIANIK